MALMALLPDEFPGAAAKANFRYYEPRCAHGSSLSAGIHALVAARLGETDIALHFLRRAAAADLELDPNSAGGIRIAGLGGLWQAIVLGFAGLGMDGDAITLTPRLPEDWRSVSFAVQLARATGSAADCLRYRAGRYPRWRPSANPSRWRNPHRAGGEHAGGALRPADDSSGVMSHLARGRCGRPEQSWARRSQFLRRGRANRLRRLCHRLSRGEPVAVPGDRVRTDRCHDEQPVEPNSGWRRARQPARQTRGGAAWHRWCRARRVAANIAATILLPQAIVAAISPWIGRRADRSGRRPLLLLGWGLLPVQGFLYAALPGVFALVLGNLLNGVSGAIFGVTMTVVAADLTRRTGGFNLTLGALGVAISVGASLSTFLTGISAALFGARMAVLGLALVGLCGLLLLWARMPETREHHIVPDESDPAEV